MIREVGAQSRRKGIGFGASAIAGLYRTVSRETAMDTLNFAWSSGIRHFDTAPFYGFGLSERRVGDFLRQQPQGSFEISTKVGRVLLRTEVAPDHGFVDPLPFNPVYDYSYDGIMRSFEDSLQRTGLSRFDTLYVHDIGAMNHGVDAPKHLKSLLSGGLKALDELKRQKAVRFVGLGVNEVEVCLDVLAEYPLDQILLANRYTLLDRTAERALISKCKESNTLLVIGGVFNSGILATGAIPGAHFEYAAPSPLIIKKVNALSAIANSFNIPLAAAALQFPHRCMQVRDVLIGTAKVESLKRNLELLDIAIPEDAWSAFEESLLQVTN